MLNKLMLAMLLALIAPAALAKQADFAIGMRQVSYVDESRPIKKTMGFEGAATRRLDLRVWYPADATSAASCTLANGAPSRW